MQLLQGIQYGWESWEETNDFSDSYNPLPLNSPALYATGVHLLLQTSPISPLIKRERERGGGATFAPVHSMKEYRGSKGIAPLIL
jgi:hypothetical protein